MVYFIDLIGKNDIVYAIDSTIPTESFDELKTFVNEAVKPLYIEKENARIGLLKYGAKPVKLMDFKDSSETKMNLLMDTLTQQNENSDPVKALKFIQKSFYDKQKSREDAEKTIVLLINGERAQIDPKELEQTTKTLNSLGISYVFIVIGGSRNIRKELKGKGDRNGTVYLLGGSDKLPTVIPDVIKRGKGKIIA